MRSYDPNQPFLHDRSPVVVDVRRRREELEIMLEITRFDERLEILGVNDPRYGQNREASGQPGSESVEQHSRSTLWVLR
jgi:hypothetical protein